jgi:hypothetical protein
VAKKKTSTAAASTSAAPTLAPVSAPADTLEFPEFLERLGKTVPFSNLSKALAMLRAERFELFAQAEADSLVGVVKSQTNPDLVYACKLAATGHYSCCTQNLNRCGGLQGGLCKHLLVLVVGLTKAKKLDGASVNSWVESSRTKRPVVDKDASSAIFLRYKGAEAGEIDWRPTETIPEDYYAL